MKFLQNLVNYIFRRGLRTLIFIAVLLLLGGILRFFDIDGGLEPSATSIEVDSAQSEITSKVQEDAVDLATTEPAPTQTEAQQADVTESEGSTTEEMGEPDAPEEPAVSAAGPVEVIDVNLEDRPLPADWYLDSDFNGIPNFMELEMGLDPFAQDCGINYCQANVPLPPSAIEEHSLANFEGNIMLIFDASESMGESMDDVSRMEAGQAILEEYLQEYIEAVTQTANVGLIVYGHKGDGTEAGKADSCSAVEQIAELGAVNSDTVSDFLSPISPTGWTPIDSALTLAYDSMQNGAGRNKIILFTDGLESCDGDPQAIATTISNDPNAEFTLDIIGLGISSQDERNELKAIASSGNGQYINFETQEDFKDYQTSWNASFGAIFNLNICSSEAQNDYNACVFDVSKSASTKLSETRDLLNDPAASADIDQMQDRLDHWREVHLAFSDNYFDHYVAVMRQLRDEEKWGYIDVTPVEPEPAQARFSFSSLPEGEQSDRILTIERPADCDPGSGQDFSGQALPGTDFSGQDLRNASFRETTLNLTNFENADLSCADFRGAKIIESNFTASALNWAVFTDTSMAGANFTSAHMEAVDFARAELNGGDFTEAVLTGSSTDEARISNAVWQFTVCPDGFWVGIEGACYFP